MHARTVQLSRFDVSSAHTLSVYRRYSTLKSQNPANQGIVDCLTKYKVQEDMRPNPNWFKINAFNAAILTVSKVEGPIRTGEDIKKLPGIGAGMTRRVNDYLFQEFKQEPEQHIEFEQTAKILSAEPFSKIPGIGPVKTRQLVEAGCVTMDNLLSSEFTKLLTPVQLLHVKYMKNGGHATQRRDADTILQFCREHLQSPYEIILVGDYRRGLDEFPVIDIVLSHPDHVHLPIPIVPSFSAKDEAAQTTKLMRSRRSSKPGSNGDLPSNHLHDDIIPTLRRQCLIADTLTTSRTSWSGYVLIPEDVGEQSSRPGRARAIEKTEGRFARLTLHLTPKKILGPSLIYHTGDSMFKNYIRSTAQKRDILFTEHGLWQWTAIDRKSSSPSDGPISDVSTCASVGQALDPVGTADVSTAGGVPAQSTSAPKEEGYWALQPCPTEEDVFRLLKIPYVKPEDRTGPRSWLHGPQYSPIDDDFDL